MALPSLRNVAICSGSVLAALGLGAALFAWSGLYNVAASDPHFAVTHWLLDFGKRRSIETHSLLVSRPALDDPDLVALGAGHFQGGCAPCHGAPGQPSNSIVRMMLPRPPDLARAAPSWTPGQLHWIVEHGVKFTGMPAWTAPEREDELQAIVAFLRALPNMDAKEYERLAAGGVDPPLKSGRELAQLGSGAESLTKCARCHGAESSPSGNQLVPKLAGQSQAYMEMSLRHYANGLRPSGIMQPVAAALDDRAIVETARYYARLPAAAPVSRAGSDQIERGKSIATTGVPDAGIPPCLACHSGRSAAAFPILDGQHARYLAGQLRLLRRGLRSRSVYGAIMSAIAPRLTEQQIDDAAAYFASVAPPPASPPAAPARAAPRRK